jgi:hypothetical protein
MMIFQQYRYNIFDLAIFWRFSEADDALIPCVVPSFSQKIDSRSLAISEL